MTSTGFIRASFIIAALATPALASAQSPDRTPGDASKVKIDQLCAPGFEAAQKPVATWQRTQALERYGIRPEGFDGTLDHLVPVSLGGSNDPDNLWPFHPQGIFTLEAKTALADKLKGAVCAGAMTLKDAQAAFKKDWTKTYKMQMGGALNAGGTR
jgi:hypothetical protein